MQTENSVPVTLTGELAASAIERTLALPACQLGRWKPNQIVSIGVQQPVDDLLCNLCDRLLDQGAVVVSVELGYREPVKVAFCVTPDACNLLMAFA